MIVAVLNNFHFDLSNSTLNVKTTPVPKIERDSEQNAHTSASGSVVLSKGLVSSYKNGEGRWLEKVAKAK